MFSKKVNCILLIISGIIFAALFNIQNYSTDLRIAFAFMSGGCFGYPVTILTDFTFKKLFKMKECE